MENSMSKGWDEYPKKVPSAYNLMLEWQTDPDQCNEDQYSTTITWNLRNTTNKEKAIEQKISTIKLSVTSAANSGNTADHTHSRRTNKKN